MQFFIEWFLTIHPLLIERFISRFSHLSEVTLNKLQTVMILIARNVYIDGFPIQPSLISNAVFIYNCYLYRLHSCLDLSLSVDMRRTANNKQCFVLLHPPTSIIFTVKLLFALQLIAEFIKKSEHTWLAASVVFHIEKYRSIFIDAVFAPKWFLSIILGAIFQSSTISQLHRLKIYYRSHLMSTVFKLKNMKKETDVREM